MPIVTATEITVLTNISASAATITASGLIPLVQERINYITNNWFTTDIRVQGTLTFNATARTVVSPNTWATFGFADGDEVYIYHSYRNDGYYTSSTFVGSTMTLVSGSSVIDELSGRSIMVSVVSWPPDLKMTASLMVAYDYDSRPKRSAGVKSRTLGPWSESYDNSTGMFGYPDELINALGDHKIARLM